MNDLTTYDLPNYVQPMSLQRLREKIELAERQMSATERETGIIVSSAKRKPTSIRLVSLRKRVANAANRPQDTGYIAESEARSSEIRSGTSRGPGGTQNTNPQEDTDDDTAFRDSVLHCMFNTLGLEQGMPTDKSDRGSIENSPRIPPSDTHRSGRAHFGSELGNMALFDLPKIGSDIDSETAFTSNSMDGIESEMDNDLEIIHFPQGAVLVESQERNPGLYYVIDGFLDVGIFQATNPVGRPSKKTSQYATDTNNPLEEEFEEADDGFKSLYLVKPGGIAGYQAGIGNSRSFVDVRAKTDVLVGFLPRASLERIMEKKPVVLLTMAKRLISLLSPLILHLDFALEWLQVDAGHTIYSNEFPCCNTSF